MPVFETRRNGLLRRFWSNRLWILAAVLGGSTLYSGVTIIHDGDQRGTALGLVTQATALHVSALASARLERLSLEAFAPAGPVAAGPVSLESGRATIELLARRQREGRSCACRDLLPVAEFFHVAADARTADIVAIDSAASAPSADVLAELARAELAAPRTVSNSASHFVADARLGDRSVVTLVQRDDRGAALGVYGMVVETSDALAALFARPQRSAIDSAGLTQLDSLSLEVRGAGGRRLFGALGSGRARAIVHLGGPMRGLLLTIAVAPSRVASPLLVPHTRLGLWNLGALLAATIIVLLIAIGVSRRELTLARARSDFIAGVSHDLRMPLAQILIASETLSLRRERNDGERVSLASSIVRETRRLMALVDNVLLFSRSGAVELKPTLRPVSVTELLADVVESVRLAVDDAGQSIEIAAAPATTVLADRRLVRQALVNLVDNALKYGAPGQRIRLGTDSTGASVRLFVDDEGPGIPAGDRSRIFEPYERLVHDQASERTGSGLGLAVVRQIAEACGGRVWLEDAPTRGARVVIELRAAAVMEPVGATPEVA
ncbi:MAG TPA: HAMP domain-containing sensor histidine kinase [Gemmatimonadaceae bacterium]|nr:HAMP domain-containing sensor histidine kinase [Gemmatimonadaceae bacterium]